MEVGLVRVEADRLKRTPAANPDAEDLALQCNDAVSKRKGSFYRSGRSRSWLKAKNPDFVRT
jgi:hypothetical protein